MENYINILHSSELFVSVCEDEIKKMLPCLQAQEVCYKTGERILPSDYDVGVVVYGDVCINAADGSAILTLTQGGFISASAIPQNAYISAASDCTVMFFSTYKLLTVCFKGCPFHQTVIKNIFSIMNEKISEISRRLIHLTKRSIREKLLSYLRCEADRNNNSIFEITLTRKQLAEHLCVDRAAMTTALFALQKDGIIKINRNRFELLK